MHSNYTMYTSFIAISHTSFSFLDTPTYICINIINIILIIILYNLNVTSYPNNITKNLNKEYKQSKNIIV